MITEIGPAPDLRPPSGPGRAAASSPRRRRRGWILATAVALSAGGFAAAATLWAPLHRQVMLSISQRPAPYTEMYFTDFAHLPPTIRAGVAYPVEFTLVAHEGAAHQVPVSAVLEAGGQSLPLGQQVVQIGRSNSATATFSVKVPRPKVTYTLVISMPSGQSIQWRVAAI